MTVCNQNRVNCKKLEDAKNFCEEIKNISVPERYNHSVEYQKISTDANKTEADYTICDKMTDSGNESIIEYLFDEGKCGDICKNGNVYIVHQFSINLPLYRFRLLF